MATLVSIVIVNWNGQKYIRECLDSLISQTYPDMEIILVDNASTDGSADYVRKNYPAVKVIESGRNLGFAGGTNLGIKEARGDLIALFNQDAAADKMWLEKLVGAIGSSDDIAAVAGKILYWQGGARKNDIFCTWAKIDPHTAYAYNFMTEKPGADVDYLPGCAMLIKRKALDRIGPLDEGYFLYFEETDWCARAIMAGHRLVYVLDAVAWHVVSSSNSPDAKLRFIIRNRVRFALKNFDRSCIPVFARKFLGETYDELVKGLGGRQNEFWYHLWAIGWNALHIIGTVRARRRDLGRIKNRRSYNRSLPLRSVHMGS